MNRFNCYCLALCLSLLLSANLCADTARVDTPRLYTYELLAERPHHPSLFTQGLLIHDGLFYESSGLYGRSRLVGYPVANTGSRWAQLTGRFTRELTLDARYFAEGLTYFNDRFYLLTWREGTLLVIDPDSFTIEKKLRYRGEGWGLTHDDEHLIRSDGSDTLFFHAADDFRVLRQLPVRQGTRPVSRINELETIKGNIWANIWYENRIVEIDPRNGQVIGSVDLTPLVKSLALTNSEQVLNGIAYDEERDAIWVTGKLWPTMFLIKLSPTGPAPDQ